MPRTIQAIDEQRVNWRPGIKGVHVYRAHRQAPKKDGIYIIGLSTAAGPNFARYPFQAGNGQTWGDVADFKQPVTNGELMELYTDTLPPGTYTIRLHPIDTSGNASAEKA
jgi:hypothetical protein